MTSSRLILHFSFSHILHLPPFYHDTDLLVLEVLSWLACRYTGKSAELLFKTTQKVRPHWRQVSARRWVAATLLASNHGRRIEEIRSCAHIHRQQRTDIWDRFPSCRRSARYCWCDWSCEQSWSDLYTLYMCRVCALALACRLQDMYGDPRIFWYNGRTFAFGNLQLTRTCPL